MLRSPRQLTFVISSHDPDYPVFSDQDILNHHDDIPELEALGRAIGRSVATTNAKARSAR